MKQRKTRIWLVAIGLVGTTIAVGALALLALIVAFILATIPYLGWLINLIVILFGLGALLLVARTPRPNWSSNSPICSALPVDNAACFY